VAHGSKPRGSAPGRAMGRGTLAADGSAKDGPTAAGKGRTDRNVSLGARAG